MMMIMYNNPGSGHTLIVSIGNLSVLISMQSAAKTPIIVMIFSARVENIRTRIRGVI